MDRNLLKPLIAVIAATVGLGIWQYARASSAPAPQTASAPAPQTAHVTQIDGGNMPADHTSHHPVLSGAAVLTNTLPGPSQGMGDMSAMMKSGDMADMMKSGDMAAMMKSGDMAAVMESGDMAAMMKSDDMAAMMKSGDMKAMMDSAGMNAADEQACLDAAGDVAKMQAHMARMSPMPGNLPPDTESAK